MFSSFKEKLNTSLTSIQEKGIEAAKAAQAAAAHAAASAGNSPSHQQDLLQDSLSASSTAGGRPGSPATASPGPRISSSSLFRRSLQTGRQSSDLISFATSPPAASSPAGNKKLMALVKQLTLDPLQEKPDPAQLEAVKAAEPGGIEMTDTVIEKLERLQRYEARFPDLATAFKNLVQEKVAIETVLKTSTPLEDLSDVEALDSHLRNMAYKSEISMQEIKRLNEELQVANKTKELHRLESASQSDMIENLQEQLATKSEEIENLKSSVKPEADAATKETPEKEQERIAELKDKIKTLEKQLASAVRTTSTSAPPTDPLSDPLSANVSVPEITTTSTAVSGASSPTLKDKKTTTKEQKKKDQALRDLMVRLEGVMKEKKQVQHEQEQAEVKLLQLQLDLDKEVKVKKEMVEKLDELQKKVAEMEEKEHKEHVLSNKKPKQQQQLSAQDVVQPMNNSLIDLSDNSDVPPVAVPLKEEGATDSKREAELKAATLEAKEVKKSLLKAQADAEAASEREAQAVQAKEDALKKEAAALQSKEDALKKEVTAVQAKQEAERLLAEALAAGKVIKDEKVASEKELKIARAQVKELQKLDAILTETTKQLADTQKELEAAQKERDQSQRASDEAQKEAQNLELALRQDSEKALVQLRADSHKTLVACEEELTNLRNEKAALEQRVGEYLQQTNAKDELIQKTQEQLEVLRRDIQSKEESVRILTKERDDLKKQLREMPDLSAELASAAAKVEEKEKDIRQLQETIKSLTAEKDTLVRSASEAQEKVQALVAEKAVLSRSVSEAQDKAQSLKEENEKALLEWKSKVDERELQLQAKVSEMDEQQQEVMSLNKEKEEILAKMAVVQEKERNSTNNVHALEENLVKAKQEVDKQAAKVSALESALAAAATATAVSASSNPNNEDKENANTKDDSAAVDELKAKITALEAEVVSLNHVPSKNAQKKLRQELNHTKAAKQEAEALVATLKADLEKAQAAGVLGDEASGAAAAATTAAASNAESEATIKTLKDRISEQEKIIEDKVKALVEKQSRVDEELKRQETLRTRILELEDAANAMETLKHDKEALALSFKDLEIQLANATEEHSASTIALQKSLQEFQDRESGLAEELQAAKMKVQELTGALDEARKRAAEAVALEDQHHEESVEQIKALTQEREALIKKHQDLEVVNKAAQEKQVALEKKLELLHQDKTNLEAQVKERTSAIKALEALHQEKIDLENKVKEQSECLSKDQDRVKSEIEKIAVELETVRISEREATAKVETLTQERDAVHAKVLDLEKRLEDFQKSKKGHQDSLATQIEALTKEKERLAKDLEVARAEFEKAGRENEESLRELQSKYDVVVVEKKAALAKVVETEQVVKGAQDTAFKVQEAEEKIAQLTKDFEETKAELMNVQSQLQESLTSTSAEISELQDQLKSLTDEKATMEQQHTDLQNQLKDTKAQKDEAAKLLKVLEEDNEQMALNKTEAQQLVTELQSKVNSLMLKDRDTKEALALAKSTIHQRDEDLEAARKIKIEDDEKLQKSMTLLKTTRKQILRLEKEKQEAVDELEACKVAMAKVTQEAKTLATKSAAQQAAVTSDLSRLQAVQAKMAQDKEKLIQEKDQYFDQLQMKQAEFESSQTSLENVEHEMREYRHQLEESRDRVTMLEEETSHAKRLAESKVAECEGIRRKATELEAKLEQIQATMKTRSESQRNVLENLQQEVEETRETMGAEIDRLKDAVAAKEAELDKIKVTESQRSEEVRTLKSIEQEQSVRMESTEAELRQMKSHQRNLELELQHFKDLEGILAQEKNSHEKHVEESKMRESHLRTMNKTLKEEVRKLQKQVPGSPSSQAAPFTPGGAFPQTPSGHSNSAVHSHTPTVGVTPGTGARGAGGRGGAMSPQSTPPSTPNFGRMLQQPEDDVNVEYLKNVLLSFMEHKERRQQLVPVVAQVLKLTPDETKRLSRGA
ncbi:hypothetical protein EC991_011305 [Linnemannia zychae]|nr:hypothetical protein EC991_011305 [Linnemannia zychae]